MSTSTDNTIQPTAPPATPTDDTLRAVLSLPAARYTAGALAGAVLIAALIATGAAVFDLLAHHMGTHPAIAGVNAALVALAPIVLAAGAVQATRERTRAALVIWFVVWALVALSLASVDGVLSAGAIVLNVEALTTAGKILAPLPGALAVATIGAAALTLRGDDADGAMGDLLGMIAKACLIGFSSFGVLNVAMLSGNIRAQAFGAFVALVVETMFVALLARKDRGPLVDALTWLLASVLGLNAVETVSAGLSLPLPAALAWLPQAGALSLTMSGAVVVASVVALSLAGKRAAVTTERRVSWSSRVADLLATIRGSLAQPERMPASAALAAEGDGVPALEDTTPPAARAEVAPRKPKSARTKRLVRRAQRGTAEA